MHSYPYWLAWLGAVFNRGPEGRAWTKHELHHNKQCVEVRYRYHLQSALVADRFTEIHMQ